MLSSISSHPNNSLLSNYFTPVAKFFSHGNLASKPYNFISEMKLQNQNFSRFFSKTIPTSSEIDSINPDKLFELGSQYFNKKDFNNAITHFKAGADKNHTDCMNAFAICLYNGHGIEKDLSKASTYFQNAADKGHKEAQYYCGMMYLTGNGKPTDLQKAANYLKKSADQDYGNACFFYAYLLMGGTEAEGSSNTQTKSEASVDRYSRTGKESFKYLNKGSELGNPACQCAYGIALYQGENINPDKRKGIELIKKSSDQGYPRALNFYGKLLSDGVAIFEKSDSNNGEVAASFPVTLIEKDEKLAADKFAEAASRFDPEGCYNFANVLLKGKGVTKDTKRALIFIKKSAQLGFPEAICDLASFYEKGIEVQPDIQKAAVLYKQAADLGSQGAAVHYGQMCMDGKGVKKNVEEATKYFKMAMRK